MSTARPRPRPPRRPGSSVAARAAPLRDLAMVETDLKGRDETGDNADAGTVYVPSLRPFLD
jgi:hypothetical protein